MVSPKNVLVLHPIHEEVDGEAEEGQIRINEARLLRRLRDSRSCRIPGHTYCYAEEGKIHLQLTDAHQEEWAHTVVSTILFSL